jgi:hypothetical protein
MMNDKIAGPIAGAGLEPWKVKKQLQLRVQDSNLAKLKQTKERNKHQQVQLQVQDLNLAKLNQTTISNNQRTNKKETTNEPVNNICVFNDD